MYRRHRDRGWRQARERAGSQHTKGALADPRGRAQRQRRHERALLADQLHRRRQRRHRGLWHHLNLGPDLQQQRRHLHLQAQPVLKELHLFGIPAATTVGSLQAQLQLQGRRTGRRGARVVARVRSELRGACEVEELLPDGRAVGGHPHLRR